MRAAARKAMLRAKHDPGAVQWRWRSFGAWALVEMAWRKLGKLGKARRAPVRFAEGRVAFAIGDIHGRADLLSVMLEILDREIAVARREGGDPLVVFLGDYVDRGPESARVIDLLLNWTPERCERRFLLGNHEQGMLAFLDAPATNRAWLMFGGTETLASYGIEPPSPHAAEDELESAAAALRAKVLPAHLDFLKRLELYVDVGEHVFVHAGVDPARRLDQQRPADMLWIRERFLSARRRFSHRVVHGHTPASQPYADARRIGVDTGAYATGTLTAARIEAGEVTFLAARDETF